MAQIWSKASIDVVGDEGCDRRDGDLVTVWNRRQQSRSQWKSGTSEGSMMTEKATEVVVE